MMSSRPASQGLFPPRQAPPAATPPSYYQYDWYYVYIYIYIYIYGYYVYIYICTYVCICVYISMYTHNYTHIFSARRGAWAEGTPHSWCGTPGLHNKIPAQKIVARGWVAVGGTHLFIGSGLDFPGDYECIISIIVGHITSLYDQ